MVEAVQVVHLASHPVERGYQEGVEDYSSPSGDFYRREKTSVEVSRIVEEIGGGGLREKKYC